MKLAGYIKAYKEFMFTIPIYTNGDEFFSHDVDTKYRITKFNKIDFTDNLIKTHRNVEFRKDSHGALIFVGEKGDLFLGSFEDIVKIVKRYLQDKTPKDQFLDVKEDISYFESLIPEAKKTQRYRVAKPNENRISYNDIRYIINFLNHNNPYNATFNHRDLINSVYEKVANSDNKEKAIIEFRNEIIQLATPVFSIPINRNLNPHKKIKLNKLVRKKPTPTRQNIRKQNIEEKVIFIKDIIEKIEGKQGANPKLIIK